MCACVYTWKLKSSEALATSLARCNDGVHCVFWESCARVYVCACVLMGESERQCGMHWSKFLPVAKLVYIADSDQHVCVCISMCAWVCLHVCESMWTQQMLIIACVFVCMLAVVYMQRLKNREALVMFLAQCGEGVHCTFWYTCLCVCILLCVCARARVCVLIWVCAYAMMRFTAYTDNRMCACVRVCVCVCVYMCVHDGMITVYSDKRVGLCVCV